MGPIRIRSFASRAVLAVLTTAALVVPIALATPASASGGQVQGIVTRAGGAPLPATSVASVGVKACTAPSTETCAAVAITSATIAGGYNLGLEAGDYDLWVVNLGNTRPLGGPFPVSVPEGGTAVLSPEIQVAIVQGTVTSAGVPFPPQTAGAGACAPDEPQSQSCPSLRAQFAHGDGNYALALPPDDWTLRGFHNPGSSELSDENPTFTLGDGDVVTQNFNIPPAAPSPVVTVVPNTGLEDGDSVSVTGIGFLPNQPVAVLQCANVNIGGNSPCNVNGGVSPQPLADGDGKFGPIALTVYDPMPANVSTPEQDYPCGATGCLVAAVASSQLPTHFDGEQISFGASGTVSGTVLDGSGSPAVFGGVAACPAPGTIESCPGLLTAFADAGGNYTLTLPAGTYNITGFAFGGSIFSAGVTVTVAEDDELVRNFEVLFGTISGSVTDGAAPFRAGTAGAVLCPDPASPGPGPLCPGIRAGFADAGGNYSLLLPPGTYNVAGFLLTDGDPVVTAVESITIGDGDALVRNYTIGDTDGVPDEVEDEAPNGGDGNDDGTPDSEQPHVASLPSAGEGNSYVTLAAPDGTTLVDVEAIDPSTLPPPPGGQALPVGVLSFEVQGVTPGGAVNVEVVTPAGTAPDSYLKFQNGAWLDFTGNSSFAGDIVTLSLTDGGAGDADGTANGVIVDPGAPALASADAERDEGDHGARDVEVVAELASRTDPKKVRIDYCTEDGSAVADGDYRADCKHVNLNKHESSARIKLKIRGDQLVEGDEDFFVDLTA